MTDQFPAFQKVTLDDDPELVAERERNRLGVTISRQSRFRNIYDAFSKWREILESQHILILQSRITVAEARGFSLLDNLLPVIAVSISDSIRARVFTLLTSPCCSKDTIPDSGKAYMTVSNPT